MSTTSDFSPGPRLEHELLALAESEERFRLLVTATSDVVYRMNPDWSEMKRLHDREFIADSAEPSRDWMEQYIHPDDRSRALRVIGEAIRAKSVFELEHRVVRDDGSLGWTSSRAVPILGKAGEILEWFGTATDVTSRREVEEALRQSEQKNRTLFESMDEGFCVIEMIHDADGSPSDYRFLEVNPAFERQTGLRDVVGKRVREFVPKHETHWFDIYGRVAETGEPVRFENGAKELNDRWFDVYAFRIGEPDQRKVAVLFTDISERKRLERSLHDRVRELAEADQRKDEFLAMLAHELRNPLSAIHSAVRVAQNPGATGHLPQTLGIIERQTKNLVRLIDDLLDVSRITQGKVELRREHIDVIAIINRAFQAVRPLIEQKHHDLKLQHDIGPIMVNGDPTRLEQIVGNLLVNAAKYTEPSGYIWVSAVRDKAEAVIKVRDDGVGISPAMLPRVFDLFTQVDHSLARSEGGLGIGLSLVKRLVEMHGGSITVMSEPGCGSEFTLRLPLIESTNETIRAKQARRIAGEGRKVLLVDDNADTADLTGRLLEAFGFMVKICHDGTRALELAGEFRPEVVLLDIGLPGMDGYQVARRLRQEEFCRDTLLIAVSGYGDAMARQRAHDAGFDHHFVKPVDIETIAELVPRS